MNQIKNHIKNITNYKAGKSIITNNNINKGNIIKLSSNENALASSQKIFNSLQNIDIFRYPDSKSSKIREKIAKLYNINKDNIICGNGSDEIISLICEIFLNKDDEVIVSKHSFLMYEIYSNIKEAKIIKIKEDENYIIDIDDLIKKISKKSKIIFLANPNNPTGSYISKDQIKKIINIANKNNIILVFDLAYYEYGEIYNNIYNNFNEMVDYANKNDNIILTRTFSKIYGLASLRIGYMYNNNKDIITAINKVKSPFNVNQFAQIAAITSLDDTEFKEKSQIHNNKSIKLFKKELKNLNFKYGNKIRFYDTIANFILIRFINNIDIKNKFNKFLQENNILVRELDEYHIYDGIRFSFGNDYENNILLEKMTYFFDNI